MCATVTSRAGSESTSGLPCVRRRRLSPTLRGPLWLGDPRGKRHPNLVLFWRLIGGAAVRKFGIWRDDQHVVVGTITPGAHPHILAGRVTSLEKLTQRDWLRHRQRLSCGITTNDWLQAICDAYAERMPTASMLLRSRPSNSKLIIRPMITAQQEATTVPAQIASLFAAEYESGYAFQGTAAGSLRREFVSLTTGQPSLEVSR